MKKVYSSSNEFGMYYVGTPDSEDIFAYDMGEVSQDLAERISAYAERNGVKGWVELEMVLQPEGYYIPVIPGEEVR